MQLQMLQNPQLMQNPQIQQMAASMMNFPTHNFMVSALYTNTHTYTVILLYFIQECLCLSEGTVAKEPLK